ncbi:alginate lyase family protein [Formosa sediminum]|uniref:Alginate lyase family protein n=1 Tax=Formosa sediminum TaxID=2594004 RepID=A0A516GTV5_9FLAO|nr:alginate lyase family protein [Formosa sediminum]QDO94943.1 alginate lyase family protein [Formosa sediminum]
MQTLKPSVYLLMVMCLFSINVFSNPFIRLDSERLAITKTMIINGTASKHTLEAYTLLIQQANILLDRKNPTVMDKSLIPPSGDKHDYLSISRYWWPDPDTKDGLPWIRRDGKTNPDTQTAAVDRKRLALMGKGVYILGLAYYFTEDETYASKAISMLDTWFISPDTRMNPHLNYGQSIPGQPNTRPFGILDGRSIVQFIPDTINLVSTSVQWTTNHQTQLTTWLTSYLEWLTESSLGIKASELSNNHGSWYKFQVLALARYLGDTPLAKKTIRATKESLDQMLNTEGGQIHELERTRSYFYSCFNLEALTSIAKLADPIAMDVWAFETQHKKSLSLALQYLTPVVKGETWPHDTLKTIDTTDLIPIVSAFYDKYKTDPYYTLLQTLLTQNTQVSLKDANLQEFWLFHPEFNLN